jgi:poly(3-hydroxybutyrate) depolymerase
MANPPASGSMMLDVDGVQRQYIVKVPTDYDANKPYRLIFAWHGLGGTAMQIASTYYGLTTRSANSAIFVAAQGLAGTGQQSGLAAWSNTNDSDITFVRKLLAWAKTNYCIDIKRVFSIGMSNGGMMSNIVGCELGDSFRAMVAMSGGGPKGYAMKPCTGQLAVWISHGNKDDNVPFSYGQMSRDYWAKANHCSSETLPATPGTCVEYQGCDPGFPVQFCEFDGGHMVPSFAGEAAWKFFERF